jgi:hypothetical protein
MNPLLGALQDNGGSIAGFSTIGRWVSVDAGDAIQAPPRDQRGVTRPLGPASDIGTVEDS